MYKNITKMEALKQRGMIYAGVAAGAFISGIMCMTVGVGVNSLIMDMISATGIMAGVAYGADALIECK